METLKKIGITLLTIIFPLGILYCMLHTLGKSFITFLGGIFIGGICFLIGMYVMYIVEPQIFCDFFTKVTEYLSFINN